MDVQQSGMQTFLRQCGKCLVPVLVILMIVFISVHHRDYIPYYSQNKDYVQLITSQPALSVSNFKIEPINRKDWGAKFPKYKGVPDNVTRTDWWRSAAFIEWDLKKRGFEYRCIRVKAVGNWWICLDKQYRIKPPCLVYSFGIGFDFSFDDAMAQYGCEVHSFDPSMKMKEHVRNTSVHFYPIGLGHVDTKDFSPRHDIYVKDNTTWPVMTLQSVMKKLGHTKRQIDVLKIDVEGYEWDIIDNLLKNNLFKNVKQFMLEYHLFPKWPLRSEYPKLLQTYKTLHDIGFQKFIVSMHPLNHNPKDFNIQADVAYINTRFVPRKR